VKQFKMPRLSWQKRSDTSNTQLAGAAQWTGGQGLLTKITTALLCAGLVAGPAASVVGVLAYSTAASARDRVLPAVVDRSGERAAVTEFAGRFVVTWLGAVRGQESSLAPFVAVSNMRTPTSPATATNPVPAAVTYVRSGVWSVTVSVTVTGPAPSKAAQQRYFQVPVLIAASGGLIAESLPSPVAGPATAKAPPLGYSNPVALTSPMGSSISEFLAALLTGSSDVTRLVSPGGVIAPVTPPPYTAVRLSDLTADQPVSPTANPPQSGGAVHVLVTAEATASPDQTTSIQYALTMRSRAGRWEVAAIEPAPRPQTSP
jgi:hypothetical protein